MQKIFTLGFFLAMPFVLAACATGKGYKTKLENGIRDTGPVAQGGVDGIYVPVKPDEMRDKRVLMIIERDFNDMETFYPFYRLVEEGYQVTVASIAGGHIQGYGGHVMQDTKSIIEVDVNDYDALYLPGGQAPARLRQNQDIINAVREFGALERPIGAVCHGPQVLVTAGLARGRNMTAFPDVGQEIIGSGGTFVDQPVVVDRHIVTSRLPSDLPLNMKEFLRQLE